MSQTTEIPFIGVHNTTTENLNENGEVAMSFGLTSNDVAATTTMPAVTHLYHIDGCRILLIHNGSGFKNVFVARPSYDDNGEVKKWTTEAYTYEALNNPDETPAIMCSEPGLPNSTAVLGNVVVLNYDDRCRYAFRKNDTYVIRDNTLPPIVFEAAAAVRPISKYGIGGGYDCLYNPDRDGSYFDDLYEPAFTNAGLESDNISKVIESFISSCSIVKSKWGEKGFLISPILIRLAYRLKSGDIVGHTNPVLCMPMMDGSMARVSTDKEYSDYFTIAYTPYVRIVDCANKEYEDLIDCIEIYTSIPLIKDSYTSENVLICRNSNDYELNFSGLNLNGFIVRVNADFFSWDDQTIVGRAMKYNFRKLDYEDLFNVDSFYFARYIKFDDIDTMNGGKMSEDDKIKECGFSHLEGCENRLWNFRRVFMDNSCNYVNANQDAICTRARMNDPFRPNIKYNNDSVYSFNKRIAANGISYIYDKHKIDKSYFSFFFLAPNHSHVYKEGRSYRIHRFIFVKPKDGSMQAELESWYAADDRYEMNGNVNMKYDTIDNCVFEVYDKQSGGTFFMTNDDGYSRINEFMSCEEPYVKRIFGVNYKEDGRPVYKEVAFNKHDFLNMSVRSSEVYEKEYPFTYLQEIADIIKRIKEIHEGGATTLHYNDYIRLSNVGDPYSFDASNTAYFNSPVERVMIVPEAITLGQYGTDQIYVICQDGVYTVGLNDEGKLTRVNTFTSDKIDANRACIAGGQLFVNNGISWDFYQGQNRNQFLSMKRNTAFHFDNLPHILSLNETKQWEWCLQGDNLFDFMQRCTLYYDSINAQIIGVVPNTGFYLVWSKDDGFRMVKSNAEYRVQYNTLLLADNNSNLYDFEATDTVQQDDGMVIMRPFHLNAEQKNGLSTVRSVIVRGNFDSSTSNCAVKIILYGTMDYKTWHVVASSTRYYITGISGTPYAAFRLVILARLKRDEYLSHITVEYDNRESKRLHF